MKNVKSQYERGISIIEVILSLALLSFFLSIVSDLSFSVDKAYSQELIRFQNLLDVKKYLEKFESNLNQNFAALPEYSSSTVVSISDASQYVKEITLAAEPNNISFQTRIADWKNAFGGSSCSFSDAYQWKIFSVSGALNLGIGNSATSIASRGNFVFLTADSATKTMADFFVVDVSDKNAPHIMSQLDTGPGLTTIKLAGKYAYAGNSSINGQIQIIDISNPLLPVLVNSFKIPGAYSDATTIPNSLFYYKSTLYVGTKKSQITEFHIFDVSDVKNIFELGSYEMNTQVNDTVVREFGTSTLAFLASPDKNDLTVIDVSDPKNIKKIGGFDGPGTSVSGKSLSIVGNTLFLGRSKNSLTPASEMYILDISKPENIVTLGKIDIGATADGLISQAGLLFIENQKTGDNFQIWDVTKPLLPVRFSSSTVSFSSKPVALSCRGNTFFIAFTSNDALRIISPLDGI